MKSEPYLSSSPSDLPSDECSRPLRMRRAVSWGAIFAGVTAALALQVLFMMLGAGLGFAIYSPLTDANPVAELGKGALVIQGISAVFSLWFGGWVAGRFALAGSPGTGWLHGFGVWSAATVAGVLFVAVGAGWALGDLSKLVGGGLSLAGKPAAAVAGGAMDAAKEGLQRTNDMFGSFVDEATSGPATGSSDAARAAASIRGKREVTLAVARLFNPLQSENMAANRTALITVLVERAGMNATASEQTVTEWTTTYNQLKTDLEAAKTQAEAKAREAADKAADALAVFSLCAFGGFLLGAIAASWGGCLGARRALRAEQQPATVV